MKYKRKHKSSSIYRNIPLKHAVWLSQRFALFDVTLPLGSDVTIITSEHRGPRAALTALISCHSTSFFKNCYLLCIIITKTTSHTPHGFREKLLVIVPRLNHVVLCKNILKSILKVHVWKSR